MFITHRAASAVLYTEHKPEALYFQSGTMNNFPHIWYFSVSFVETQYLLDKGEAGMLKKKTKNKKLIA